MIDLLRSKIFINSIGVALTSVGAFLVWRYLTEISFVDKDAYLRGEGTLIVPDPSPEEVISFRRSVRRSKVGLGMILLGGVFQIVSNYMSS